MTRATHHFQELIAGQKYQIEVAPVSKDRWRAYIVRVPGVPTALMPFYGSTPADAAEQLTQWLTRAHELAAAGAQMLVLEMVPATLAAELTAELQIPVIGIGAGVGCSGQVLVLHDMLDITRGKKPRFVKNFMAGQDSILAGVQAYVNEVKAKTFPVDAVHGF